MFTYQKAVLIKKQPEQLRRTDEDWLGNELEKAEEQSRQRGLGKALSLKTLTPKQESEELLQALNTIDSKDNEIVNIQMRLNADLSSKYIMSQQDTRPPPIYNVPYERRIESRQSDKTEFRETAQKRKTFSVLSNAAQLNMNDEFKRQVDYLKTPSDTFYNGRTTQQSFKSTNGSSNQNTQNNFFSEGKVHRALATAEERHAQQQAMKQITSHKTLAAYRPSHIDDRRSDSYRLEHRYNRYMSMADIDGDGQYRDRYDRKPVDGYGDRDIESNDGYGDKEVNLEVR